MCSSASSKGDGSGEINGAAWKAFVNALASRRELRGKGPRAALVRGGPMHGMPWG